MSRHFANLFIILSIVLALAILGGLIWANGIYVRSRPVEKNFLVPWLGARTFLLYGDSPYSTPATQRAQILYYGRLATAEEDPLALWLPFPVELFYFPLGLIPDYALARAIWMTGAEIATACLAFLCLRLVGWKPPLTLLPLVFLFFLFSAYGVLSIFSGSGAAFVAVAMAGFLLALRRDQEELAGALFLLTAMLPSLTGLFTFFFLWWILFRRRWRVLGGFAMALAFLLALSFLFLPNWFIPFLRSWFSHVQHASILTSVKIFASWSPVVGSRLGWAIAAVLFLILCVEWGASMRDEPRRALWTICLTITVMPLMAVPMDLANYIMLYIPLMILLGILVQSRSSTKGWGPAGFLLVGLFASLWVITAILLLVHASRALTQTLYLFLPLLIVPSLYWVRWRFIRPAQPELNLTS